METRKEKQETLNLTDGQDEKRRGAVMETTASLSANVERISPC